MDTALLIVIAAIGVVIAAGVILGYFQTKHLKMPKIENVIPPVVPSHPAITPVPQSVEDLDKLDYYHPGERLIYTFFAGKKTMRFDPVVIEKRMKKYLNDLRPELTLANSQHSEAQLGQDRVLAIVRDIFEVKALEREPDGDGLTELETMWLFDHYIIYNESVKKNWRQSPTSPTATSPTSSPTSGGAPPTSNGSASGSSATASCGESATPSSRAS